MNSMADVQRNDPARRPQDSSGKSISVTPVSPAPRRTRLIASSRTGQRLSASGMVGGLLPGMILGLVVGLLTGSFVVAAIAGTVAIIAGGMIGARLARRASVDTENPSLS